MPATFTAMLRGGTEPDIYYTYFTDLPQMLLAGQAANITQYVNSTTVPMLGDIAPSAMKAVDGGQDYLRPADLQLHPGPDLQQEAVLRGRA